MTVWNIHLLNARHDLTLVLSELRATAREAVALASAHAELPRFDLVIRAGTEVIPEWGIAGCAPAPGIVEITLNPDRFQPALMLRTLIHELHHAIRWDGPGYGRSLGDALVSEGLAGHFVLQVLGGKPDPWDATTAVPGLARRAMNEWARLDYDHPRWFLGKGDIRKWAGYGLGHRLVAEHLAEDPQQDPVTLAWAKSEGFRPTLRRLVNAEPQSDEAAQGGDVPDNSDD